MTATEHPKRSRITLAEYEAAHEEEARQAALTEGIEEVVERTDERDHVPLNCPVSNHDEQKGEHLSLKMHAQKQGAFTHH